MPQYKKVFVFLVISACFITAVARMGYYLGKVYLSDLDLFYKSNEEIRILHYGQEYLEIEALGRNFENENYLITNNGKTFFLGRYLLFPKRVHLVKSEEQLMELISKGVSQFFVARPYDENIEKLLRNYGYSTNATDPIYKEVIVYKKL